MNPHLVALSLVLAVACGFLFLQGGGFQVLGLFAGIASSLLMYEGYPRGSMKRKLLMFAVAAILAIMIGVIQAIVR